VKSLRFVLLVALALRLQAPFDGLRAAYAQGERSAAEAAAVPFVCPAGTERMGAAPPDGFEVWCERPTEPPERRREGPARAYYDDGGLAREQRFEAGRLVGPFREFHRNGRLARNGTYAAGERDGTWLIFRESGVKEEESEYARGAKHGAFVTYHPDGRKKTEGRFCRDLQCGTWTSWDEAGRELGRVRYEELKGTP
jgi:hypothetical protein